VLEKPLKRRISAESAGKLLAFLLRWEII